jgi:hypothetical protein
LYGLHRINLWSFAPDLWRPWWIWAMMEMTEMMGSYRCVTLSTPHSKFRDVTLARNVVKDCIRELWLADLVQTMNRYLLPMIRCPVIRFIDIKLVKYDLSLLSWMWVAGWHKHTCTPMTSLVKYNYVAVPCAHKKAWAHEQYADLQN